MLPEPTEPTEPTDEVASARPAGRVSRAVVPRVSAARDRAGRAGRRARERTASGARATASGARRGARAFGDRVSDLAVRVPVRDLDTLRRHHGDLEGEALADAVVEAAVRTTGAFGAAGGLAAIRLASRRNPVVLAVQLVAEPLAVAAIEIKLMAELHEVYDVQVAGSGADRARFFAKAWATARGVNPLDPGSARSSLGDVAKGNLGRVLAARMGTRLTRSGPFVAAAAAGGLVNGRGTRELAEALRAELRTQGG